ncbi:MAG TPA: PAS domain-containing sensor histidine kinase, partial [Acidimicrobiales bacterium]|nr:PAS domain-containing sensor histidine kinase [Acidimicrobiales bacterium]
TASKSNRARILRASLARLAPGGPAVALVTLRHGDDPAGTDRPTIVGALDHIFRASPDVITILDEHGRQLLASPSATEQLGYGGDQELVARADRRLAGYRLIHPDDVDEAFARWKAKLDGSLPWSTPHRYRVLAGDGTWRWLETADADLRHIPEVGGIVAFSRDVTVEVERTERMREAEARLAAVVTSLHTPVAFERPDGELVYRNRQFDELADTAATDAGTLLDRLASHPDLVQAVRVAADQLDADRVVDLPPVAVDDRMVAVEVSKVWSGDELRGRFWRFTDVTNQVLAERVREQLLADEAEARHLAEERAERLDAIDRARSAMVSNVSHELRTPLSTITSAIEHLRAGHDEAELTVYLPMIERNAHRLTRVVDDLLTSGRLDAGLIELDRQRTSLADLVAEVVAEQRPAARARHIDLSSHIDGGPAVFADPLRIAQVLENLIANAIKFTAPDTAVRVEGHVDPAGWVVVVRDQGPGVPPVDRHDLFRPFHRGRDTRGVPGSGLGLSIARGLMELHGGTLELLDEPGWGAVFCARAPIDGADR